MTHRHCIADLYKSSQIGQIGQKMDISDKKKLHLSLPDLLYFVQLLLGQPKILLLPLPLLFDHDWSLAL